MKNTIKDIVNSNNFIHVSRTGITRNTISLILKETGFTLTEFGKYIHLTPRAIQRKKNTEKIASGPSERALLIARLYFKGSIVFGHMGHFKEWMETQNSALGNSKPKEYLDTFSGIEYLMDELGRIEHGLIS